jgi:pimeloyl-ACP methyl ester carboxylesterase
VIVPDLRGLGWSSAPAGRYEKATLADDVLGLLDAEGLDTVKLMGHDWGGYTGFLLTLAHPERIERFVALDIGPPWGLGRPQPRHLRLPFFMSYQLLLGAPGVGERVLRSRPEVVRGLIRAASGPGARWTREELDAYAIPLQEPERARASSAYYRTFLTRELPVALRGAGFRPRDLRTPTLQIMGEASPLYRATGAQPGPDLEVRTVPGAGHFLPEEAPDTVLALAGPFLG